LRLPRLSQSKCLPNQEELKELRAIIAKAAWKKANTPEYADAPHSYVIRMKQHNITAAQWVRFAEIIGEPLPYELT